ncbi:MAG: 16S rRNA processing protein RimM [Proteobacteria bacterium]|nr:MAG: 16S rRNA processing protein RimM [Pseudomonadota bacterium]
MNKDFLEIAKIGKTVGLRGDLKLHFLCDFPEQFKKGAIFGTKKMGDLEITHFDKNRSLIRFKDYDNPQIAQKLVNTILLTSIEKTRQNCPLKDGEFFWFDIIGLEVKEDGMVLGLVDEISRIANQDYLHIKTHEELVKKGFSKSFLIPYVDRFIVKTDIGARCVFVKDGLSILESS